MLELLKNELNKTGIYLNDVQLNQFETYMNFLVEYNKHTNLTSITNAEDILIKHFFDSIVPACFINLKSQDTVVDIGTGAGFPGIPLKIYKPDIKLTLVDSLNKRVVFLKKLCEKINLEATVLHARAEELSLKPGFRESFDVAVSRAVAPLNALCEYCLPYVRPNGIFVAMKGPDVKSETENSLNKIQALGGKIKNIHEFNLPLSKGKRNIVVIDKVSSTPKKYPRKNSQIIA